MNRDEYLAKKAEFKKIIDKAKNDIDELEKSYGQELMTRNGYKTGDILKDCYGKDCVVVGVSKPWVYDYFYLECKKLKKDGTPSQKDAAWHQYPLKQE